MSIPFSRLILTPVLTLLFASGVFGVTAQSLFTIDGAGVSKDEFLKAYNKNNNGVSPTERTYREYLDLYIRYKLKVRAAYAAELDTLPAQRTELQNFRSQVADTYLKDEASLDKLVREAYDRGQKDIRLAHIFIALPKSATPADTLKGYEKAMAAYNMLKKTKRFAETALAFSEDPAVKSNRGEVGYITVLTLPYELESLAYSLTPGQYSKPYRSKGGYHIFKNEGERKSLGRIKIAQILLSFPPSPTAATKDLVRRKADSIAGLLQNGADFATVARKYSSDNLSYQNGGEMPEFGVGRYDSVFEAVAFGLDKDGGISAPFASDYGYHIIKRIARKPFPRQFDAATAASLKALVLNDPRIDISRQALLARIYKETGFQRADIPDGELWSFTDSALRNAGYSSYHNLSYTTPVFGFTQRTYTVKEWLDYAKASRAQRAGAGLADKDLFERYIERTAMDYYRNHLEQYNKDFAFQLTEFKEGNLLFEIMQRKIWDKASTDSAGLAGYYEAHKSKYWWNASADAILFTCNNEKTAEALKTRMPAGSAASAGSAGSGGSIEGWRKLTDSAGAAIQADSGRYELAQIPGAGTAGGSGGSGADAGTGVGGAGTGGAKPEPIAGSFTEAVANKADNTVSFAYILTIYHERSPRNFRDARGFVINDYQAYLEDQWIAALKKLYPVKMDVAVLASLPK
jgi:peptidyl-prolyl cis-trans isomerase SurA